MVRAFCFSTSVVFVLAGLPAIAGDMSKLEITFVDHIKAELVEQDVYVEREKGSGMVFRVTVEDNSDFLDKPVYATAKMVHHDPMNMDNLGPHEKGDDLGFTLGEWLNATGTASYTCSDGKGALVANFEKLVPNGLYTMWNFYMAIPFTEPFSTYDTPVGKRNGSDSIFKASADGKAEFTASFEPCLQGSGAQLGAGLAIAFHSDGKTYGHEPGSMGDKSHVHLFAMLPESSEMPN